jgi:hypothetical protein
MSSQGKPTRDEIEVRRGQSGMDVTWVMDP